MKTRIVSFILMVSLVFSLGTSAFAAEEALEEPFAPEVISLAADEPLPAASILPGIYGWVTENGRTYYYKNGRPIKGWQLIDSAWYYFDSTGAMVTSNWASDKSGWYFMGSDGRMMEGFREIALGRVDDGWYYFNPKHDGSYGLVLTGGQQIGGTWYYFNPKHDGTFGRMVRGDWVSDNTGWYFMDENGEMMEGLSEIALGRADDGLYYFNPKHDGSYGRVLTGWQQIDGVWYYFNPSHDGTWGRAYDDGWNRIGGKYYYFYSDGAMASDTIVDGWYVGSDGQRYFQIQSSDYTVTFDANGGYGAPATVSGSWVYVPLSAPSRDGYIFLGYSENRYATRAEYTVGQVVELDRNMTLYAVWEKQESGYSLTFDANGGTNAPKTIYGNRITIPATVPSRPGYVFLGWSQSSYSSLAYYKVGDTIDMDGDVTLYAVWHEEAAAFYQVTFDGNGGTGGLSMIFSDELTVIEAEGPTRSGYKFLGWSENKNASSATYELGYTYKLTRDLYLYAVWQQEMAPMYSVSFDTNGGTGGVAAMEARQLEVKASDAPTRSGYKFLGWSEDKNATSATYELGKTYKLTRNLHLYAVWQQEIAPMYGVTFDVNDGTGRTSISICRQFTVSWEEAPTRPGYEFFGWSENKNATSASYIVGYTYKLTRDLYLYAVWGPVSSKTPVSLNVPSYKQTDNRWGDVRLGTNSGTEIRKIGCLVTAISMIQSYRTGQTVYPDAMSKQLSFTSGGGLARFPSWLSGKQSGSDYLSVVYQQLKAGRPVLLEVKKTSGSQHWVVITGFTGGSLTADHFTVNDPGSSSRSVLSQLFGTYPTVGRYFVYS